MSTTWQHVRCECGNSYGMKIGANGKCSRCDSSKFTKISEFDDPQMLSEAVAKSNLPEELRDDISARVENKERKARVFKSNYGSEKTRVMNAMKRSTDSNGILRIDTLEAELQKLGVIHSSPELLIGQAEIEGILMRHEENSWTWL